MNEGTKTDFFKSFSKHSDMSIGKQTSLSYLQMKISWIIFFAASKFPKISWMAAYQKYYMCKYINKQYDFHSKFINHKQLFFL